MAHSTLVQVNMRQRFPLRRVPWILGTCRNKTGVPDVSVLSGRSPGPATKLHKTVAVEATATHICQLTLTLGGAWNASREVFPTQHRADCSVDGWSDSNAPFSLTCRFRLGTPGSPITASGERCGRHRGRAVVFHGRGCRHIPGRLDPSLRLWTFGCRKLRKRAAVPSWPNLDWPVARS